VALRDWKALHPIGHSNAHEASHQHCEADSPPRQGFLPLATRKEGVKNQNSSRQAAKAQKSAKDNSWCFFAHLVRLAALREAGAPAQGLFTRSKIVERFVLNPAIIVLLELQLAS